MSAKIYNEIFSVSDEVPVSQKLLKGINKVANPVKSTFGPAGKNVIIETVYAGAIATKDGVTVAKSIKLEDPVEDIAARLIKQVASKAVAEAGDGTTTSTILAQALYANGLKYASDTKNKNLLKKEIEELSAQVIDFIKSHAKLIQFDKEHPSDEILNIAKISSNGDNEMAKTILDAFSTVGVEGVISIDEGYGEGYCIEHVDGLRVNAGLAHPLFKTDERKSICEYKNASVLIVKDGISNLTNYKKVLEKAVNASKPIVIISDMFTDQVITLAVTNKLRGVQLALIKVQGYGMNKEATFEDIAALTGARIIDSNVKEEDYLSCIGNVPKIIINKNETEIISDNKQSVQFAEHIEKLKNLLEDSSNLQDKEKLSERIGKLIGGVAIITVKGKTDEEIHEKKDRVDDAVSAVRSAIEEGYIPGSSVMFMNAAEIITSDRVSDKIMKAALEAPLKTLCENTGYSYDYVKSVISKANEDNKTYTYGIDFSKNTKLPEPVELISHGIIDPVKVLRVALESAVSITNLLITSDNVITMVNKEEIPLE